MMRALALPLAVLCALGAAACASKPASSGMPPEVSKVIVQSSVAECESRPGLVRGTPEMEWCVLATAKAKYQQLQGPPPNPGTITRCERDFLGGLICRTD